jgi:hypothetical protein
MDSQRGSGRALLAGCVPQTPENAVPASRQDVEAIRDNESLTLQERRETLAAMGLSEIVINVVMIDQRLANQFGGDLRTALNKVSGERLSDLTPDEVQYYADAASGNNGAPFFDIQDEEAQAISDLFVDENINSADDVEAFLDDPNAEIPEATSRETLQDLFVDVDPNDLVDQLSEPATDGG